MYNLDDLDLAVSNAYDAVGHVIVVLDNLEDKRIKSDGLIEQEVLFTLWEFKSALEKLATYFGLEKINI